MKPINSIPKPIFQNLIGVLTDIDDTITIDGYLPAAAYSMLERLRGSGLLVIPITGRPAGWCDMIARFWPVDGVVGENGAFSFHYDHKARRMMRRFVASDTERRENRSKLETLSRHILAEVPGSAISADSFTEMPISLLIFARMFHRSIKILSRVFSRCLQKLAQWQKPHPFMSMAGLGRGTNSP